MQKVQQRDYNRIKSVLAEKGKTAKELYEHLGVNKATASRWCQNQNQPYLEQLFQIADWLDIDVRDLIVPNKPSI